MSEYTNLVKRLRSEHNDPWQVNPAAKIAAEAIEFLQRELKCANELWEQQKELALAYLADIEKANERIADLEAALKPFAEVADLYLDEAPGNYAIKEYLSRFRAARKVLGEKE